jgi:hypothetical protein
MYKILSKTGPNLKNKSYLLIFASEINEFHYRAQWDKNLLIPLSEVMKLIYPTECGNETHYITE